MRVPFALLLLAGGCEPGSTSIPDEEDPVDTDVQVDDTDVQVDDTDVPVPTGDTGTVACPPVGPQTRAAVVTDIDETLTTLDAEWLTQIALPSHDPQMRPDANTVMQTYVAKGYRVFYITARGNLLMLLDGTPARDATEGWLDDHAFPYTSDGVFLAGGLGATGNGAVDYKAGVIADLQGAGFEIVAAYGNADTDIEAYKQAGIPDDDIYLVGALAGQMGVVGIPDDQAYTAALPFVESIPCGW